MFILNYLYFLIISIMGVAFLLSKGKVVKNPLDKSSRMMLDGPELFWCLTFATGLMAFSAPIGMDLMAIRLLVLEGLCVIGLFTVKRRSSFPFPLVVYSLFLLWILIGCFYGPSLGYGIRVVLKYSYPILLCLFASAAVRDFEVFIKSALLARMVALVCVVISFIPFVESFLIPGVFWYATARAINFISMMVLSLALFHFTAEKKKNLILAVVFILPCFLWVFRTSIMGSLVAIMAFYFIKYRTKSLPIIAGILFAGVAAVFMIPSLHEKMFGDQDISMTDFRQGEVTMDNVNTNARQAMWEDLMWRFYEGHEITGSGTGSVQNYMYNNKVFGGLKVCHSDFVQMLCDNGVIAIVLYVIMALVIYFHCCFVYWGSRDSRIRLSAIVAGASLMGVLVTLYSDNTVNYSMATLSMPFGFYGMMLGLRKSYR